MLEAKAPGGLAGLTGRCTNVMRKLSFFVCDASVDRSSGLPASFVPSRLPSATWINRGLARWRQL